MLGIGSGRLSSEIETIKIHHLRPCSHKVLHELLLRIAAGVDLGKSAELGVRSKDEVHHSGRPLQVACAAVASFQHAFCRRLLPLCAPMSSRLTKKSLVGLRPLSENAVLGMTIVRTQYSQSTDQDRSFGSGQGQQLRLVDQQVGSIALLPVIAKQVFKEVVTPLRRRTGPDDFQAAGERVRALTGVFPIGGVSDRSQYVDRSTFNAATMVMIANCVTCLTK